MAPHRRSSTLHQAIARRPILSLLLLSTLCVLAPLGDLLQPVLPAIGLANLALALAFGLCLALAELFPRAPRCRLLASIAALLLLGFFGFAVAQWVVGAPRGLFASQAPDLAQWQDRLLHTTPPPAWEAERLRAALDGGMPRPYPASADEFLFNALLLRDRGDASLPAAALAESLRRATSPRPDALLLYLALIRRPAARPLLAPVAADLPAESRALLGALMQQEPAERVAALEAILADRPADLLAIAALAQARIAASLPEGPTIATASLVAQAVTAFADPNRLRAFASEFLDQHQAILLARSVADLAWTEAMADRRLAIATLVPPPDLPEAPILLRLTPPEAARSVQIWQDEATGWFDVPVQDSDNVPTLRMERPFRPRTLRLRYLDRAGVASAEVTHEFNPVAAIRAQAQRRLQRVGPFALYQPGWIAPGQINPLPLSGMVRAGLQAIEWRSDADATPHRVPVALPDAALLGGDMPRILVDFAVPETARMLFLTPVLADGSRGEATGLAIR